MGLISRGPPRETSSTWADCPPAQSWGLGAVPAYVLLHMRGKAVSTSLSVKKRSDCFFVSVPIHSSSALSGWNGCCSLAGSDFSYCGSTCSPMSSGSGVSSNTTLTTVSSSSSAASVPPPPVPASTALTPAVVSLLGSLVRNIVRSEMASASAHSPAGSVPPPPATSVPAAFSAPPLVSTVHSSAPVVSSPTIPAGITSGMPLLYCVSHVRPPIPLHWEQLTMQWQVFWGEGVGLRYWDCFDHGHDCCDILPSLSCDRQVPVVGEDLLPGRGR